MEFERLKAMIGSGHPEKAKGIETDTFRLLIHLISGHPEKRRGLRRW